MTYSNSSQPDWSPRGNWLAVVRGNGTWSEIWLYDLEQNEYRQLTDHAGTEDEDFWPQWSPDGNYIAYLSSRNNSLDIYVIDPRLGKPRNLTADNPLYDGYFDWSSDGRKIVYESEHDGKVDIYLLDILTGENRVLVSHPQKSFKRPCWTWNGEHVVFTTFANDGLWIVDNTGENLQQLSGQYDIWAACSPKTPYIAVLSRPQLDANQDLWLYDLQDLTYVNLTNSPDLELYPQWSPNGEAIAFYSNPPTGPTDIIVLDVSTHEIKNITQELELSAREPTWSPSGTEIGFTADLANPTVWVFDLTSDELVEIKPQ
ncbi:MAG: DPP IV N-terminal domain-containing protein [Anaerolineae bacterium]|nr:DPP IV N-terminal domain-containing protein [Anaerolineae bacterium]